MATAGRLAAMTAMGLSVMVVGLVMAACGSTASSSLAQADLVGNWSGTVAVGGRTVPYYWVFEDGDHYGSYDGCNWGGGSYSVSDGRVTFGDSGSTTRACLGPDGQSVGIDRSDPPDFEVVDSGRTLVVQTTVGEVRLPRVDTVPTVD